MIELTAPQYLLLLLVVLPLLAWVAYQARVGSRGEGLASLCMLAVSVSLLCLALTEPKFVGRSTNRERMVVVAYDVSASVGDAAARAATGWHASLTQTTPPARVALLPFASALGTDEQTGMEATRAPDAAWALETDIAAAIQGAVATSPDMTDLLIISDGHETRGDAVYAAGRARVSVSVVPVEPSYRAEVQLAAINIPPMVREQQPFTVGLRIVASQNMSGNIEVYENQRLLESQRLELSAGENRFQLQHVLDHTRLTQLEARLVNFEDTYEANNRLSALLQAEPKPHVLVVDPRPAEMQTFQAALELQGIRVWLRRPEFIPDEANRLGDFEAVVLSHVAATEFNAGQLDAMRSYVRDLGGGLLMLGSDRSFGLGGYSATPLAEVLPVHCDYERQDEVPSLAIVLAIDRSSSMVGLNLAMAKEATVAAAELLDRRDQLGIIAFDAASRWLLEIGPISGPEEAAAPLESVAGGGGTAIQPALIAAHEALLAATAKLKHVILLTDGHSVAGDLEQRVTAMATDQITLSTVAVGASADQARLARLAELGGGRTYFCVDPQSIPQVFAKETMVSSLGALDEQPFRPQVTSASAMLRGLDLGSAPPLYGYVRTRPKATAELVLTTESATPLLASWRVGMGKSVAFTSDAKARWARDWLEWSDYGRFWAQVTRHTMRDARNRSSEFNVRRLADKLVAQLDAVNDNLGFRNSANLHVDATRADLTRQRHPMALVAPGRYQAVIAPTSDDAYHLSVSELHGGRAVNIEGRSVASRYRDELRLRPANTQRLSQLASVSGGLFNPASADLLEDRSVPRRSSYNLVPLLLSICLLLFVTDVALRRLRWLT